MRINQIKADKEYADCHGRLIVPVEPVSNRYRWEYKEEESGDE